MRILQFATFLLLFTCFSAYSEEPAKKIYTAQKCISPVIIDGIPDDPVWGNNWEDGFIQREPYEKGQPSQRTSFQLVYDDEYIYVAIKAFDTAPDSIVSRLSRRDKMDGDQVGIVIDSYHDLRTAFMFSVSASGVKSDEILSEDGAVEDLTWDPIWFVKTKIHDWGWCAELKIPLTQLRFEKKSKEVWGFDVHRFLFRKNELSLWQHISRTAPGFVSFMGELAFQGELKPRRQIDLTPYVNSSMKSYPKEEGNMLETGHGTKLNAGLDGKIGVTNNLTLDFTINPDFGQVEADPSQVNLTAYETFYVEQRPFFIEGKNITRYPLGFGDGDLSFEQLFYSRRIGRKPQYTPDTDNGVFAQTPSFTSILGAAKLTGKSSKGWSVGVIESVGAEETALIDSAGHRHREAVEPLTNYFVGRIQKDINKGNTIIGLMGTSTDRRLESDALISLLHKNGRSGAFDFKQYFNHKNWLVQLNTVFSNVKGSKEALAETQTSSAHLFQRPDASHLTYDSNRTSLSGNGGNFQLSKIGGNLNCLLATMWKSPGLEINDIGYLRSTDEFFQVLWAGYKFTKPTGIMRSSRINFNQWNAWNYAGEHLYTGGNFNGHVQFKNQWALHSGINIESETLSASQLRGGPAMLIPGNKSYWYFIESDVRKKLSIQYQGQHARSNFGSASTDQFSPIIRYQPFNTLEFTFEPSYILNKNDIQYVEKCDYGNAKRYVLGSLHQQLLSFSMRINVNLTPNLTLQYWGQPFATSGNYNQLKMVTQSRNPGYENRFHIYDSVQLQNPDPDNNYAVDEDRDGVLDYKFENPNFNFNEFLSNLVVRYEYVPGSVVYFVWSQSRQYQTETGKFDLSQNLGGLYNQEKPTNTLMVKFSYRIALH
jgi:hypothetical protein